MTAAWLWIRLDLRRRARSLLVLAFLVFFTSGVILTAAAGARRGASAVDRLASRTAPATIAALPNEPGFDWDKVRAIDGVEAVGVFPVSEYKVDGVPDDAINFAYDRVVMHGLERPVVLEGRVADPDRDDEAVITKRFEDRIGKRVGDTVTVHLYTPAQIDVSQSDDDIGPPKGPAIKTRIVGVIRSPWFLDYGDATDGTFTPSAGLFEHHRANLLGSEKAAFANALIRLRDGAAGVPRFREQLARATGRNDIEFFELAKDMTHVRKVTRFEADALTLFTFAAGIAALFLVGQSVVRYVAGSTAELSVLGAIGMQPRLVRMIAAVGPTLASLVGATGGLLAAWVASSHFPIGTARPIEPHPGRGFDALVLWIGVALVILLTALGSLGAAWAAARRNHSVRPSRVATALARAGAPVPVTTGTRFALERGTGPQSVPTLPAIIGSIVGVVGIVAALTFASGIDDATSHPSRFGVFAQLESFFGFNGEDFVPVPVTKILKEIAEDKDVTAVNDDRSSVAEANDSDVTIFSIDPIGKAKPPIVVLHGRLPRTADEIAIAPSVADEVGVDVGDTFKLAGKKRSQIVTVTGTVFVPEGPHNEYDEGAWLTKAGYDRVIDGFKFHLSDITLRDGADVDAVAARINTNVAKAIGAPEGTEVVSKRTTPSRIDELKQLRRLPVFLAGFLAVLAITAVGHAVATAVRRRRHDLAVVRAIGLTRFQTRSIALTQATVLALIGVLAGVPIGVAIGRSLWTSVADRTPVELIQPLAVLALVLIAPAALLAANLLAAWPSQRAASLRVGHILRTE